MNDSNFYNLSQGFLMIGKFIIWAKDFLPESSLKNKKAAKIVSVTIEWSKKQMESSVNLLSQS